jgi:DNA-binding response OmpR family regulator
METGARLIQAGANACTPIPLTDAREPLEVKIRRVLQERKPHLVTKYYNQQIHLLSGPVPHIPQENTPQKTFLEIDLSQKMFFCQGQRIHLQQMQFKLLLTLALTSNTYLSKQDVIYDALFGEPDADEDRRPYERQIDNAKSKLIKAFTPVLGEKAKDLILTQPKVGIKLNLTQKEIVIIGKSGNITSYEPKENSTTLFDLPQYPPPICHQKPSACNRHCFL